MTEGIPISGSRLPRIPPAEGPIQVNHCKHPHCVNFGIPAADRRGAVEPGSNRGRYALIGGSAGTKSLMCHGCRTYTTVRSNIAIREELDRFDPANRRLTLACCPKPECSAHGRSVIDGGDLYRPHGKTKVGAARYRCKACGSTFSAGPSIRTQRRPELDTEVLRLLVNKVPMRRICEILAINPATLYGKLGYLAEKLSAFSAEREVALANPTTAPRRAYLSIDRQDQMLNWATQFDRRNIRLGSFGAVENHSGYVLAMQLNFDPSQNAEDVEAHAIQLGDYEMAHAYRRYARLWLRRDYERGGAESTPPLDFEEQIDPDTKAPPAGMQVRLECTQYALFFRLKQMLTGVEKLRFFMDRDPGMEGACLSAFCDDVKARRVEAFLVRTAKTLTIDAKKQRVAKATVEAMRFGMAMEGEPSDMNFQLVRQKLTAFRAAIPAGAWFPYPIADMAEPEKEILHLTDFGELDPDHLARLYMKVTLRGVDRFFMQVRRRLSLLERPIATANNARRVWHGYAAYSPLVAERVLTIFRAYYNYALIGQDKKTPAMRLGLAAQPEPLETLVRGAVSTSSVGNI